MSLHVYLDREDIPEEIEVIRDNERFFIEHTMPILDERMNELSKGIDNATYLDNTRCYDRFGVAIYLMDLSTGGKTILNIAYHPDKCFSLIQTGENACVVLGTLTEGHVYDGLPNFKSGSDKCDILLMDPYSEPEHFATAQDAHDGYAAYILT